jgi:hypothetical protein
VTWTTRTSGTPRYFYGVTYGNNTFVAVGEYGTILQSDPATPKISVTPTSLDFGEVNLGSTSDKIVTVRNDGIANLIIGNITSPSVPFRKIADNCSGQTFAPGASCTITYEFAPTSTGSFSSNSNIPSNDPDNNQVTVSLNGGETITTTSILTGPITGITGTSYSYTTGGSTSSLGHPVEYQFDWKGDDSDVSSWGLPLNRRFGRLRGLTMSGSGHGVVWTPLLYPVGQDRFKWSLGQVFFLWLTLMAIERQILRSGDHQTATGISFAPRMGG